uniref:F-box domain-containing protein n=1 Tax=Mycena chlorophos TaxID=658473 RepID=A0ABQ0LMC2_MYCCL|nr:predicted protein [Mycena chlorophos]
MLFTELLQEIASHLEGREQAALRMTCRAISAVLDPIFLSSLTIGSRKDRVDEDVERLQAIVAGKSRYCQYARRLHIETSNPFLWHSYYMPVVDEMDTANLGEMLTAALRGLNELQSVEWVTAWDESAWVADAIIAGLVGASLRQLAYTADLARRFPRLDRLVVASSLTQLNVRAPTLTSDGGPESIRGLMDLLRRSVRLSCLELASSTRFPWDDLWHALETAAVYLSHLKVNVVSAALPHYLLSYSKGSTNLEHLILANFQEPQPISASHDRTQHAFFARALPHLATSLVELRITAKWNYARWSFGPHYFDIIPALKRIKVLEFKVTSVAESLKEDMTILLDMIPRLPTHPTRTLGFALSKPTFELLFRYATNPEDAQKPPRFLSDLLRQMREIVEGYRYGGVVPITERELRMEVQMPYLTEGRHLRLVRLEAEDGDGPGWIYVQFGRDGKRLGEDEQEEEIESDDSDSEE